MQTYKILILRNKLPFELQTDCEKAIHFFKTRIPFTIEYTFKEVDIPLSIQKFKDVQGFNPITGVPGIVGYYGLVDAIQNTCRTLVYEGQYQACIFAWNMNAISQPVNGVITSWTMGNPLYAGTEFIQLSVNQYHKNQGDIWKKISHEQEHGFCKPFERKGIKVDEMDMTTTGIPFAENDSPESLTGNYARTNKNLAQYFSQLIPAQFFYKPLNFKLAELVPKAVHDKLGDKAWELLDERMLRNLQFFRENLGPIMVNSLTQQYRCFDPSEFRKGGLSQHNHGRAVDCTFKNYSSEQVREWIKKPENFSRLPEPDIWVELGMPHFHFDVRNSDKKGLYFFNP